VSARSLNLNPMSNIIGEQSERVRRTKWVKLTH
jgi:hypothetical protein